MKHRIASTAVLLSFFGIVHSAGGAIPQWHLTMLPSIPGGEFTAANDINNAGLIVGNTNTPGALTPLLWVNGIPSVLPQPADTVQVQPRRINASGTIVGGALKQDGLPRSVIWSGAGGGVAYVGGGEGIPYQIVEDINDAGDLAASNFGTAVVFSNGGMVVLPQLPEQITANATRISNSGIVVGGGLFPSIDDPSLPGYDPFLPQYLLPYRAIMWTNGTPTKLGVLPGFYSSFAYAVNDSGLAGGQVVTDSRLPDQVSRPVLFREGEVIDFLAGSDRAGPFGTVTDINERGDLVGFFGSGAFLYRDGEVVVLNDLSVVSDAGLNLRAATGINDLGQIVGWGYDSNGVAGAFLLTPVPEPETVFLLVAGLGLIALNRRCLARGR